MENVKTRRKIKFATKRQLFSLLFILPWAIGILFFFVIPLFQTFQYAFSYDHGTHFTFNGLDNYRYLFSEFSIQIDGKDFAFIRVIWDAVKTILVELPIIIIFSLFIAVLLNRDFKGRGIVRTIFFLPIIFGSSIIVSLSSKNNTADYLQLIIRNQTWYKMFDITHLISQMGIPAGVINVLSNTVEEVFRIISFSGVQILIFLSALQSINPTLYEVAKIEGANANETFWKITLPSLLPMITTAVVYTFVDVLYRSNITQVISELSRKTQLTGGGFGIAASVTTIFVAITMILLGLIMVILRGVRNAN